MENEIKKLRKQVIATQTICILMLVVLLGMMVGILQIVRVFGEYKEDLDRAATLVKELKKADIPQLAEDIHNTSEAINAVDWADLSERLNEMDLQGIKETIDSLDLEQINETLGQLDLEDIAQTLNELDVEKINQTMDDIQAALEKLDKFGFF
jgi:Mg/Co/Ni transporter MgtE